MEPTVFIDAYKAGGFALLMLAILVVIIYAIHRANMAREARMATAIDECQKSHAASSATQAALMANNNNFIQRNNEVTAELVAVLRDRPCLKDPTPTKALHHLPDIHPPRSPLAQG